MPNVSSDTGGSAFVFNGHFLFMMKRTRRTGNFSIINNSILTSKEMSFEAKGILCLILSLPDNWIFHKSWLMKEYKIGKDKLHRCCKEIEKAGYMIELDMIHGKNGKFEGKAYLWYDQSVKKQVSPCAGFPSTANPPLISTNENQELNLNTNSRARTAARTLASEESIFKQLEEYERLHPIPPYDGTGGA